MAEHTKLTKNITEAEFDEGYWYANEIKTLGKKIGIVNIAGFAKTNSNNLLSIKR